MKINFNAICVLILVNLLVYSHVQCGDIDSIDQELKQSVGDHEQFKKCWINRQGMILANSTLYISVLEHMKYEREEAVQAIDDWKSTTDARKDGKFKHVKAKKLVPGAGAALFGCTVGGFAGKVLVNSFMPFLYNYWLGNTHAQANWVTFASPLVVIASGVCAFAGMRSVKNLWNYTEFLNKEAVTQEENFAKNQEFITLRLADKVRTVNNIARGVMLALLPDVQTEKEADKRCQEYIKICEKNKRQHEWNRYIESDKYPTSNFVPGQLQDLPGIADVEQDYNERVMIGNNFSPARQEEIRKILGM
ncbi:MAG: hypothetical protein WC707_01920 [Candidatus Babeliaceae bacterium]|jgi:hypothetical protein